MTALLIFIFIFSVYFKTIKFSLIVDDVRNIRDHIKPNLEKNLSFRSKLWKAIHLYGAGTFWLKRFSDEKNTKIDHLFQTILHATACVLIYTAFGSNQISFIAALLYGLNPTNTQTSIWLNGRRYLVNVILVLIMLMFKPIGFILYPMTFMYQMTALFAPVLLGWIGIPIILTGYLIGRKRIHKHIKSRLDHIHGPDFTTYTLKRLIPVCKIYGFYVFQMILPKQTRMMYTDLFYWGMNEEGNKDAYSFNFAFLKGILCVAGSIAGLLYFKNDLFFMWLFMCLSILQASLLGFTVIQGLADRYVSVAMVFAMMFLALAIHSYPVLIAAFLVYYFVRLQTTMIMYRSLSEYYDYHILLDYRTTPIRFYKAATIMKVDPRAAWMIIKDALILNPLDFKCNLLAAECCVRMNDARGVKYYLELAELNPYLGQEQLAKDRIKRLKDVSGITAFDNEVKLIKEGKSKLSAKNRELLLKAAGV